MKARNVKCILLALLFLGHFPILNAKKSVVKPKLHNKKVEVKTGENKRTNYYTLSKIHSTQLHLGGPGMVTIYLRTRMEENESVDNPYLIKYVLDGKIVKVKAVKKSKVSKVSKITGKSYKLSVVKKVNINIPPGKHKLEVFSMNEKRKVYSKYYIEKFPEPKWSVKQPIDKSHAVMLTSTKHSKMLKYHRVDSENNFKIKGDGNSYLKIYVRGEFKHNMFSDNEIRILMKAGGEIVHTFKISSRRSQEVQYAKGGKLIPGSLNKIYLQVPKGEYEYEFVVANKSKSALMKISYGKKRNLNNTISKL